MNIYIYISFLIRKICPTIRMYQCNVNHIFVKPIIIYL